MKRSRHAYMRRRRVVVHHGTAYQVAYRRAALKSLEEMGAPQSIIDTQRMLVERAANALVDDYCDGIKAFHVTHQRAPAEERAS